MSSKIYFYRKANIKECPRLTFLLLFSLHILIIAISFGNVFLDCVTLIFCFKIISGKFLLNEFWLQVMSKILWCGGLTHITNGLNSYFPLISSLPCHSTISPLLQLNFFSALCNAWCHIWETQMTTCHSPPLTALGFSSVKGDSKGCLIEHLYVRYKGVDVASMSPCSWQWEITCTHMPHVVLTELCLNSLHHVSTCCVRGLMKMPEK